MGGCRFSDHCKYLQVAQANLASYPRSNVWMVRVRIVSFRMLRRASNCPLAHSVDSRIMRCNQRRDCTKSCWSTYTSHDSRKQRYAKCPELRPRQSLLAAWTGDHLVKAQHQWLAVASIRSGFNYRWTFHISALALF